MGQVLARGEERGEGRRARQGEREGSVNGVGPINLHVPPLHIIEEEENLSMDLTSPCVFPGDQ